MAPVLGLGVGNGIRRGVQAGLSWDLSTKLDHMACIPSRGNFVAAVMMGVILIPLAFGIDPARGDHGFDAAVALMCRNVLASLMAVGALCTWLSLPMSAMTVIQHVVTEIVLGGIALTTLSSLSIGLAHCCMHWLRMGCLARKVLPWLPVGMVVLAILWAPGGDRALAMLAADVAADVMHPLPARMPAAMPIFEKSDGSFGGREGKPVRPRVPIASGTP